MGEREKRQKVNRTRTYRRVPDVRDDSFVSFGDLDAHQHGLQTSRGRGFWEILGKAAIARSRFSLFFSSLSPAKASPEVVLKSIRVSVVKCCLTDVEPPLRMEMIASKRGELTLAFQSAANLRYRRHHPHRLPKRFYISVRGNDLFSRKQKKMQ